MLIPNGLIIVAVALVSLTCSAQDAGQTAEKVYRVCSKATGMTTDCADKPPKAVYTPDPEYTAEARRHCVQGTVRSNVIVGQNGLVEEATVTKGLGYGLDEESLKAIKQWKFEPAEMGGKPVRVYIQVETKFRMYPCTTLQPRGFKPRP